nr:hypothetical protein [Bacteroidota bacterium]
MVKLLSQYRINEYETRNLLNKNLLTKMGFENIEDSLVINWLIKTIKIDDTYIYAYNQLAQWENRKAENALYPIKEIEEKKLIIKIEEDKKSMISRIKMASLKELISGAQIQLDQLEHLINGVKPTIDFDEMNWKILYTDIYLKFIHINFNKKGYERLIQLKNKCEHVFNQLKDVKDYSEISIKEFDATTKIIFKSKGLEFKFDNKEFTPQIKSLYEDLYLRIVEDIEFYQDKFTDKKLENTFPPPQTNTKEPEYQENSMRIKIETAFAFTQKNDPRKHGLILNETDFKKLIDWVNSYFENDFTIPKIEHPIIKVNTGKGNVIYTFMRLFKEIHPAKTRPDTLFELIKLCFVEYREDKISNLKKQKEPQYYDDLISKY